VDCRYFVDRVEIVGIVGVGTPPGSGNDIVEVDGQFFNSFFFAYYGILQSLRRLRDCGDCEDCGDCVRIVGIV
jgi:hypothetical protein